MQVTITLFGNLTRYLPEGSEGRSVTLEVDADATVGEVLDRIGLPTRERSYVTVNGERATTETTLDHGDEVRVIVPLGGG